MSFTEPLSRLPGLTLTVSDTRTARTPPPDGALTRSVRTSERRRFFSFTEPSLFSAAKPVGQNAAPPIDADVDCAFVLPV